MTPEDIQIIDLSGDVKLLEEQLAAATARAEAAERERDELRQYAAYVAECNTRRVWSVSLADWMEWRQSEVQP